MRGHPWHDVHNGDNAPELVRGIIEIPKNSFIRSFLHGEEMMGILPFLIFRSMTTFAGCTTHVVIFIRNWKGSLIRAAGKTEYQPDPGNRKEKKDPMLSL